MWELLKLCFLHPRNVSLDKLVNLALSITNSWSYITLQLSKYFIPVWICKNDTFPWRWSSLASPWLICCNVCSALQHRNGKTAWQACCTLDNQFIAIFTPSGVKMKGQKSNWIDRKWKKAHNDHGNGLFKSIKSQMTVGFRLVVGSQFVVTYQEDHRI